MGELRGMRAYPEGPRTGTAALLLASALVLCSCAKKRSLERPQPSAAAVRHNQARLAESFYDQAGRLKGSSERVEWLEIPLAFQKTNMSYGRHVVYEASRVSLDRARDFFAERMLTGTVEETPHTLFYREALPASGGNAVKLSVRLTERTAQGKLELDIERLTYGDAKPVSIDEARRLLADERKRAQ